MSQLKIKFWVKIKFWARLAVIVVVISMPMASSTTVAFAQSTKATVSGTVTDQGGAVVVNVRISATNKGTGISRETNTDEAGRYRLAELSPGLYEIKAERDGFKQEVRSGIELTVGREAVVDFSLAVGSIQETVLVQGDAPLLETTNSAVRWLVNERQIEQLPLNGRDVYQLATLQNGVISTSTITFGQDEVGPGATRLSVNGGRLDFNTYYLDGTETVDAFGYSPGGLSGGFLGVDALREFEVLTSNYSAEFGQGGGAIINAVTKSGGNDLHGTAFIFHRNSALDARNFFNAQKLPFKRNQFGGSLGGPIVKDRTFFFGSFEGLRRGEGTSTIFNVPSPAARMGNLTTGQVMVHPNVLPYLALYPMPNGPISGDTGIFRKDFNEVTNEDFLTIRLDHQLTEKLSMFGRYTFDDSELTKVAAVIQNQVLTNRNQYMTLEGNWLITSRAINNARFGFNRSAFVSDFPFNVPVSPDLGFLPGHPMGAFSLAGFTELRPALTAGRNFVLNTYEVSDQFLYTRGGHNLKIGGLLRRYQLNANSALVPDGVYVYGGGLNLFLTARPQVLYIPTPGTDFYRAIRQSLFALYVQDDWKVRRNLTLNLGLRYETISTPTEANGRVSNFRNFTDATPVVGDPYIDNPSRGNFGPRIGFAWDPTGNGNWSVRAGAGIFYSELFPMRYRFQISSVPPFSSFRVIPGINFQTGAPCFPSCFAVFGNNPIPVPGLLWLTQFKAEQSTVYQWSLNVQRGLGQDFVVTAGYIGSRGVNLQTGNSTNIRRDFQFVNGQRFYPQISNIQAARLNPAYGAIQLLGFNGDAYYHGLQLTATRRLSSGLQFHFAYTYSKSIDTNSSIDSTFTNAQLGADMQDPFNSRGDRGLSDFDVRHNFVANFLWDVPLGKNRSGAAGVLAKGWSLGGILNMRSGFPFGPAIGFDRARSGIDNVQSQRPNLAPGRNPASAVTGNPSRYIDPSIFQLQPAGFYGSAGRNIFEGPDLHVFDFSVIKRTPITERLNTEFRFEAFNLFNHTNFGPLDSASRLVFSGVDANGNGIVPASFGQLTRTTTSSRQLQFGFKFIW
ncbi:MAG: TonB-dependent receptor [Acidobacteriota bacterium]|nr:TonB-dependent receptor [Blastocatellia bacterium]MDW8238279.1 TonB-dependent receptor [Acidobacteriota bacterium]